MFFNQRQRLILIGAQRGAVSSKVVKITILWKI